MRERRTFLGAVGGVLAGLFGTRPAEALRYDPTVAEHDRHGDCLAKVYREGPDKQWREVERMDLRPGDRCILLGLDGRRLWAAYAFTVDEGGVFVGKDGRERFYVKDDSEVHLTA